VRWPRWAIALRNTPLHLLARVVIALVRLLPEKAGYSVGRCLALTGWWCFPRWRRTASRNLELFFGGALSASERRSIGRQAAIHLGHYCIEFFRMGFLPVEKALAMVVEEEGMDHLRTALKLGRGAVALGMHYGNWDLSGAYLTSRGCPVHAVGKEQRDEFFTRLAFPTRARFGMRNIYTGDKVNSAVLRALKQNAVLGLLADQNGGSTGTFAPFCGIPASTVAGPAALALKTGAPIMLVHTRRIAPGRHRLVVKPPLDMSGLPQEKGEAVTALLARVNAAYEQVIREDPTQWLWGHKRWKTRPPGEPPLY